MAAQRSVLIVEDEKPLANALKLKLQHEGMATTIAVNGEECLKLLDEQAFDVVLLDMMMPVMDGFQVLQEIAKRPTKPVVFVLSNLSVHDDKEKVLSLGAKKYFIKSDTPLSVIVEEVKAA